MKPNYAPQRRKLLALSPQPGSPEPGLTVRPPLELSGTVGRQTALSVPDAVRVISDPLQPFFEACGGEQTISLSVVRHDGRAAPETYLFQQPFVLIGRCAENDLVLADERVGFRHFYLQLYGGRWMFANLSALSRSATGSSGPATGWFEVGCELDVGPFTIRRVAQDAQPAVESSDPSPRLELPAFELELINGRSSSHGRRSQPISESITLIGAARQCGLWLRDDGVSKIHASLVLTRSGAWVVDLLGRDGLLVDDRTAYWKQLQDGAVLQIGRFRFRAHFGTRRNRHDEELIRRVAAPESADSAPQAERPASSGGSRSEESVMALFERMGELQSRFFEHSQLQMQMITQMMDQLGRSQQSAVRKDLDRIDELTRELEALKTQLPTRAASKPKRATKKAPSRPKSPRGRAAQPVPAAPTGSGQPPQVIPQVAADTTHIPLPEVVAPSAPLVDTAPAVDSREFDQPPLPADDDGGLMETSEANQSPAASEAQAARLTQRMAHLARERNSVWQKVLTAFGGKSGR